MSILIPQVALPKKIAVTGHRPNKIGGYDENNPLAIKIKKHMRDILSLPENGCAVAISGMALGIDQWWAEACIDLNIPFTAALPFEGMEIKWPRSSQERFKKILEKAYAVVKVCEPGYQAWKMQQRNMWMVNNCTHLIAYWDGTPGGTCNCVTYAQFMRKNMTIFNPREL